MKARIGLVAAILLGSDAAAQEAIVFGVDVSGTVQKECTKYLGSVREELRKVAPGTHVVIAAVGTQGYPPRILADMAIPRDAQYFAAKTLSALAELDSIVGNAAQTVTCDEKHTDILGFMSWASIYLRGIGATRRTILLYTDARHQSSALDLETPEIVDIPSALKRAEHKGLIRPLDADICFLGVLLVKSPSYTMSLSGFWRGFAERSKSRLAERDFTAALTCSIAPSHRAAPASRPRAIGF
jgi:hypothetical protein